MIYFSFVVSFLQRMSEFIEIHGGAPLQGEVKVSGAKNAVLPLLFASLLGHEKCIFRNAPNIYDVHLVLQMLQHCGAEVEKNRDEITVTAKDVHTSETSYGLVKALRASFWILAPLLARTGSAKVALPGGDIIGARPVDLHLEGLTKMGADLKLSHGIVTGSVKGKLKPAHIDLRFPSVGATHQLLMAAALTSGTSVIKGAAREPEVVALAQMLRTLGAHIEGEGTSEIIIEGREELGGGEIDIIGDRIEAGTFLMATAATKGKVLIKGFDPKFLGGFIPLLHEMKLSLVIGADSILIDASNGIHPVKAITEPFPGFATDLQAVTMAALTLAQGESSIEEKIFEGRFGHVNELNRMGANITVHDHTATILGVSALSGAPVEGHDIRAAASLVVAGLAADGITKIHQPHHIRRGYDSIENKLEILGATISTKLSDPEDYLFSGC